MSGYSVDAAALKRVADDLAAESDALRRQRLDPSPEPAAGCSTGEIAGAIAHLTGATEDLARLCASMADRINDCIENYRRADAAATADLERIARGGR